MPSSPRTRPARQPRLPIEVRQEQALDAALRLISDEGYGAATMEAIAREVGIAKPVIYNAFGDREQLLRALLEREQGRALKALEDALPPAAADLDPMAKLRTWLETLATVIAANPAPWRLILIPPAETPALVRRRVEAGRELALSLLRSLIEPLLSEAPSLGLDLELAAQNALAVAEHCAELLISDPETYPPERVVAFADSLMGALDQAARTTARSAAAN